MSQITIPARGAVEQASIIEAYETLLLVSTNMCSSAVAADWDSLVHHKASYLAQVEHIKQLEEDGPFHLDAEHQRSKTALVEQILDQDAEIRYRLVARRDELGRLIGDSRLRTAVARTYGSRKGASVTDVRYRFTQKPS